MFLMWCKVWVIKMTEILIENLESYSEVPFHGQPRHRLLKSKRNLEGWIRDNRCNNYDIAERQKVILGKIIPLPRLNDQFWKRLDYIRPIALTFDALLLFHEEKVKSLEQARKRRALVYSKQF